MSNFQEEKKLVLKYFDEMENAGYEDVKGVMEKYMAPEYNFKGVYPFREQEGIENSIEKIHFQHAETSGYFYRWI